MIIIKETLRRWSRHSAIVDCITLLYSTQYCRFRLAMDLFSSTYRFPDDARTWKEQRLAREAQSQNKENCKENKTGSDWFSWISLIKDKSNLTYFKHNINDKDDKNKILK